MLIEIQAVFIGLVLTGVTGFTITFFVSSIYEKEYRASTCSGIVSVLLSCGLILFLYLWVNGYHRSPAGEILVSGITLAAVISGCLLLIRTGKNRKALQGTPGLVVAAVGRYDGRENVFERDLLKPGTAEYLEIYQKHPEWEERDNRRRARGGPLGQIGAIDKPHGEFNVAAIIAAGLIPAYMNQPNYIRPLDFLGKKQNMTPEEAAIRVKGLARSLGADLVGITRVNPLWTYSQWNMGGHHDGTTTGKPFQGSHEYAVVFATEMAFDLVQVAPHTATTIETAWNYSLGAIIATCLAQCIANLSYSAEAHHQTHSNVLLVPLAVDAGMGEMGRHGYLISKEFGSRLRLAAVTTDLPMVPDKPVDLGVSDFCSICRKCADCCPSGSIPGGGLEAVNGTLRWKLKAESCHDYWGRIGTDCNICMRVCPFSHPKTLPHRVVNWAVSRNKLARRLFLPMDNLFYGEKPKYKPAPTWAFHDSTPFRETDT